MFLSERSPEMITTALSLIFSAMGSIEEGGTPEKSNLLR